jgi:hypothetical protein
MKLIYVNYSDLNYRGHQNFLLEHVIENKIYDTVCPYTREWLETTEFYQKNKSILDKDRLAGYALWKPYIISETFKNINDGDIVVYMDCGDYPKKGIGKIVSKYMTDTDQYFIEGNHTSVNQWWTKRDCFYYMDCDEEKYWSAIQLEDGFIALRKTQFNIDLVEEWLTYCSDERIITDILNTCGLENLDGFKDHRHDQSILTNLKIKYNLLSEGSDISSIYGVRKYIDWNVFHHSNGEEYGNGSYQWDESGCIV